MSARLVRRSFRHHCKLPIPKIHRTLWCLGTLALAPIAAAGAPADTSEPLPAPLPTVLTHAGSVSSVARATTSTDLQTSASRQPTIGAFTVLGNRTLTSTAIVALTRRHEGEPATPEALDEIRANLLRTGYFGLHSATPEDGVTVRSEPLPGPANSRNVIISLDENDTVAGVNIKGAGPVKAATLQALLHLRPGSIYNPIQFRLDYADIQQTYNRLGYAVIPAPDAGFDVHNQLNVSLNVVRITEIHIRNNRKTKAAVLTREMQTRTNGYYNLKTLQMDRIRLLNLGLFDEVQFATREIDAGKLALDIDIKEKKVGTLNGGFNYGALDGLVGTATLSDNNFRGLGETLSLNGTLGTNLQHHSLDFDYRRPWLDRHATGMDLQLYDRNVYRFADSLTNAGSAASGGRYSQQQTGGSVTLSRPLSERVQGGFTLRAENTRTNPLNLNGVNAQIVQDGPLYSVGTTLQNDTRDLISDPVRGSLQRVMVNLGHADLRSPLSTSVPQFGSHNFAKSQLEYRLFYSLSGPRRADRPDADRTSLAFRIVAGGAAGHLPFGEQFFLGGADTLRGYREDRFWGRNLLLSSLELRQPVAPRFKLVAFMDVGNAWGGDYSTVNIGGFSQREAQTHVGAGLGVRVNTPIGALRIDFGVGDEGARTHFGFGSSF